MMDVTNNDVSAVFVGEGDDVEMDDDKISLTSTVESEHDPDEEFEVDQILAERLHENPAQARNGEKQYLIKWENYDLHRSTWEELENLTEELLQHYHEQREQELQGKCQAFDVRAYENAITNALLNKAKRHRTRNQKRQKYGLPLTEPYLDHFGEITTSTEDAEVYDTSSDTLDQNNVEDTLTAMASVPSTTTQSSNEPAFRTESLSSGPDASKKLGEASDTVRLRMARRASEQETSTTGAIITSRSTMVAASSTTTTTTTTLAKKFGGKRLKATRTHPKPLLQRSGTVDTGSARTKPPQQQHKARKARITLKEAMMDPAKAPRLMSNWHRIHQLHKKALELNDSAPADASVIPANYFITPNPPSRPTITASNAQVAQLPSAMVPPTGTKKARKTVRFVEEDTSSLAPEALNPIRRVSLQSYQQKSMSQIVAKMTSFGPSRKIRVDFHDIPRLGDWLADFLSDEPLEFRTVCTAADFFSGDMLYDPSDTQAKLALGRVVAFAQMDEAALNMVSANLRRESSGLFMAHHGYSVLIFPSQCSTWAPLSNNQEPAGALRYLIFRTKYDLSPFHYPALSPGATTSEVATSAGIRLKVMDEIGIINYDMLLAPSARENHAFFLLFHAGQIAISNSLSLWLRACRPDCQIFRSQEPGAWQAYQEETRSGAVILHESVEKNVRNIPRLWDLLKHGAHTFWSFSSSDHEAVLKCYAPDGQLISGIPPQLKLTHLFPAGRAFLVTPSFVVSQPRKLCKFLEWFKKRATFAPCILVVGGDFLQYLFDLAMEMARNSDEFLRESLDDLLIKDRPTSARISRNDYEDTVRAWQMFRDLNDSVQCGLKIYEEPEEEDCKIVYADSLIGPDDEQSLVNWFAAWSMTKLDAYRKFYVIGSGYSDARRAKRSLRVPNYLPGLVNDPDYTASSFIAAPGKYVFRSSLFAGDRPSDFSSWFNTFNRLKHASNFWMYFKPISWLDKDMADQYRDTLAEYGTYEQWLKVCPRFNRENSLIGLFYTPETDWEGMYQPGPAARHPWIAILRPINPHLNPSRWSNAELLIWDCAASTRWPVHPRREHLLPMQRKLIDFVRSDVPKPKINGIDNYRLGRVFVGGNNIDVDADDSSPLDVTCKALEAIVNGTEGRARYVPPWDELLFKAGWKLLDETDMPSPTEFPRTAVDDNEPERLVYHPPPGTCVSHSACTNDLFAKAAKARINDIRCTTFTYQYRPTLQWYQDLKDEKRLYTHIMVDSWDRIFEDLKIE